MNATHNRADTIIAAPTQTTEHQRIAALIDAAFAAVDQAEAGWADEFGTLARQALERAQTAWSCTYSRFA
jgi:hypothetical protein